MTWGFPEYELRSDLLHPWWSPGGAVRVTWDPGAKFRSSFSQSMMGDILGRTPNQAKSKDGITAGTLLECGGGLGPSAPRVESDAEQPWVSSWLDWESGLRGSNMEAASSSSSSVRPSPVSSLGTQYGLGVL